jgi:hypothetical protein
MTERMAPAGSRPGVGAPGGLITITTPSGRKLTVAKEYAANFQGFVNDYEAAGGVIGPSSGGLGSRPGNPSYHPPGMAIDVNQTGYGIRSKTGRTLSQDQEDALAAKWGLFPGSQFRKRSDIGHFEVRNREAARRALAAQQRQRAASAIEHKDVGQPGLTPKQADEYLKKADPEAIKDAKQYNEQLEGAAAKGLQPAHLDQYRQMRDEMERPIKMKIESPNVPSQLTPEFRRASARTEFNREFREARYQGFSDIGAA